MKSVPPITAPIHASTYVRTYKQATIFYFFFCRIVNSELMHFRGTLKSLENVTAFGDSLFDVWAVWR